MNEDGVGPTDAYGEGMDAHSRRVSRGACPYADDSAEATRWYEGWDRQQMNEGDVSAAEQ